MRKNIVVLSALSLITAAVIGTVAFTNRSFSSIAKDDYSCTKVVFGTSFNKGNTYKEDNAAISTYASSMDGLTDSQVSITSWTNAGYPHKKGDAIKIGEKNAAKASGSFVITFTGKTIDRIIIDSSESCLRVDGVAGELCDSSYTDNLLGGGSATTNPYMFYVDSSKNSFTVTNVTSEQDGEAVYISKLRFRVIN